MQNEYFKKPPQLTRNTYTRHPRIIMWAKCSSSCLFDTRIKVKQLNGNTHVSTLFKNTFPPVSILKSEDKLCSCFFLLCLQLNRPPPMLLKVLKSIDQCIKFAWPSCLMLISIVPASLGHAHRDSARKPAYCKNKNHQFRSNWYNMIIAFLKFKTIKLGTRAVLRH